jgi:hypothetical protein
MHVLHIQPLVASINDTSPALLSSELLKIVEVLVLHAGQGCSEGVIRALAFALWDFAQDDARTAGNWGPAAVPYNPALEDDELCCANGELGPATPVSLDVHRQAPTNLLARLLNALVTLAVPQGPVPSPLAVELQARMLRRIVRCLKFSTSVPQVCGLTAGVYQDSYHTHTHSVSLTLGCGVIWMIEPDCCPAGPVSAVCSGTGG